MTKNDLEQELKVTTTAHEFPSDQCPMFRNLN